MLFRTCSNCIYWRGKQDFMSQNSWSRNSTNPILPFSGACSNPNSFNCGKMMPKNANCINWQG